MSDADLSYDVDALMIKYSLDFPELVTRHGDKLRNALVIRPHKAGVDSVVGTYPVSLNMDEILRDDEKLVSRDTRDWLRHVYAGRVLEFPLDNRRIAYWSEGDKTGKTRISRLIAGAGKYLDEKVSHLTNEHEFWISEMDRLSGSRVIDTGLGAAFETPPVEMANAVRRAGEARQNLNRAKQLRQHVAIDAKEAMDSLTQLPQLGLQEYELEISVKPDDIVHKSTGQRWESKSCERVGGAFDCGITDDIKYRNAIAILRKKGGGKKWVGRVMIRNCEDDGGDDNVGIESVWYGDQAIGKYVLPVLRNLLEDKGLLRYARCETPYKYCGFSDVMHNTHGPTYITYGTKRFRSLYEALQHLQDTDEYAYMDLCSAAEDAYRDSDEYERAVANAWSEVEPSEVYDGEEVIAYMKMLASHYGYDVEDEDWLADMMNHGEIPDKGDFHGLHGSDEEIRRGIPSPCAMVNNVPRLALEMERKWTRDRMREIEMSEVSPKHVHSLSKDKEDLNLMINLVYPGFMNTENRDRVWKESFGPGSKCGNIEDEFSKAAWRFYMGGEHGREKFDSVESVTLPREVVRLLGERRDCVREALDRNVREHPPETYISPGAEFGDLRSEVVGWGECERTLEGFSSGAYPRVLERIYGNLETISDRIFDIASEHGMGCEELITDYMDPDDVAEALRDAGIDY